MPFKTPSFWYAPLGWQALLLLPVSWLYQLGHRLYQATQGRPYKSNANVICVGNAVAGGSGKTPTAIALMKIIQANNLAKTPIFLTRGYGGESNDAFVVDLEHYNIGEAGDEAYLLAQHAPTIVCSNRAQGAKMAQGMGSDLIIMDDGLQNNSLHKDATFLVIDRASNFGNGKTIPAGPLREPLSRILPKANAIICIGDKLHSDTPVFESAITVQRNHSGKYVAFAGLGRPAKFLTTLETLDIKIVGWHEFADHHLYSALEIQDLLNEANAKQAKLITTEKDHVRLPSDFKDKIETLPIALNFEGESALVGFIKAHLK